MASSTVSPDAVTKSMVDMVLHSDRIIWQQITTIMGIEALTLAAAFSTRGTWWAPFAILAGAAFSWLLYLFVHANRGHRELATIVVNKIWETYCPPDLKQLLLEANALPEVKRGKPLEDAKPRLFKFVYLGGRRWVKLKKDPFLTVTCQNHFVFELTMLLIFSSDAILFAVFCNMAPSLPPVVYTPLLE